MSDAGHSRLTLRWMFTLGALLVIGPIASRLTASLHAIDGTPYTSLLVASSLIRGALIALAIFALTGVIALPAGVLFGPRFALRMAGFCLAWASWTTGTIDEIVRSLRGDSPMGTLAIEGVYIGVLGLGLAGAILLTGKIQDRGPDGRDLRAGREAMGDDLKALATPGGAVGVLAAIMLGGLVAWIIAINPLKGQAIFAAFLGSIAAAAAAHLASISIGGESKPAPPIAPLLAIALLAIAGPLWAMVRIGDGEAIRAATYAGDLFALARILPLDWFAGAFLGIPLGIAWARSMVESEDDASEQAAEAKPTTGR